MFVGKRYSYSQYRKVLFRGNKGFKSWGKFAQLAQLNTLFKTATKYEKILSRGLNRSSVFVYFSCLEVFLFFLSIHITLQSRIPFCFQYRIVDYVTREKYNRLKMEKKKKVNPKCQRERFFYTLQKQYIHAKDFRTISSSFYSISL